jgi:hypothetical protein
MRVKREKDTENKTLHNVIYAECVENLQPSREMFNLDTKKKVFSFLLLLLLFGIIKYINKYIF